MANSYYDPGMLLESIESIETIAYDCIKRIDGSKNLKQNYDLLTITLLEILDKSSAMIALAERDREIGQYLKGPRNAI